MASSKYIDVICLAGAIGALALAVLLMNGEALGLRQTETAARYEGLLFDESRVHTIDIIMDDWQGFLDGCEDKTYAACSLVIDGESFANAAIRAKGNNSLTSVAAYGNDRYSFKVEFDHYESGASYHGLDKLNLNSLIHDNTMMKDALTYHLMRAFDVAAPLSSYVYLTVNGEDWGLYLAVEGVEEAFLSRNYGSAYGALYKPDSMNGMGGMGGSADVKLQYIDDDPASYVNIFDNAKTPVGAADETRLIRALQTLGTEDAARAVDVDAVLRYFVVHNFVCNFDSYTGSIVHNYYLYEKDGVLSMIPWDYNLAFGSFQGNDDAAELVNFPIDTPVTGGDIASRPMLAWIFASEEYTEQYHAYFAEFLTALLGDEVDAYIEEMQARIAPYVARDPTKFCTEEEFEAGVSALRAFCRLRAESVAGQLVGSIPSTDEGQAAQPAALLDASALDLAAMGSMSGGMPNGGDMPQPWPQSDETHSREQGAQSSDRAAPTDASAPEGEVEIPALPPEVDSPDGASDRAENGAQAPEPPQGGFPESAEQPDGDRAEGHRQFPQGGDRTDRPDDRNGSAAETQESAVIALAASLFALLFGLSFAFFFKRR